MLFSVILGLFISQGLTAVVRDSNGKTRALNITASEEDLLNQLVNINVPKIKQDFRSGQSWMDKLARTFGYRRHHFAVVIDCGSSGSRVHAYKFRIPLHLPLVFGGKPELEVISEYFDMTHPGLSDYADRPEQGAEAVRNLVYEAHNLVPRNRRSCTPLIIRATAGMRMLPKEKADRLMKEVELAVKDLGYDTSPGIEILDGSEEGIYFWYALNWLMKRLDSDTMVGLDLGGGSTQITLEVDNMTMSNYPTQDIYQVNEVKNVTLYTHSFLNMGRYAARFGIILMDNKEGSKNVSTVCIDPAVKQLDADYRPAGGYVDKFFFSGSPRPKGISKEDAFQRCAETIKSYLEPITGGKKSPVRGDVVGASFFFDIAAAVGIIDASPRRFYTIRGLKYKGGVAKVGDFRSFALEACSPGTRDAPYDCVDLTYIYTLLSHVYNMQDDQEITLVSEINGYNMAWPIGIAYISLMKKLSTIQDKFKNISNNK